MNDGRIASYWDKEKGNSARCGLCPHRCLVKEKTYGICGARVNSGGALYAATYGLVSSVALDPIEKKPLHMFKPGSHILSVGSFGCSFRCEFCQNYEISLEYGGIRDEARRMAPDDIVSIARQTLARGNIGAAYTYNEPLIGYEFVYDCAALVRESGLSNVLVTNGFINAEPLENLLPMIDAMNIDLKGFSESFYKRVGGDLETVKETIVKSAKSCHVEVTTLVIPGENENDVGEIAKWLSGVSKDIPLHVTRFFPRYKYESKTPTPRDTIQRLSDNARLYLRNVFSAY